MLDCALGARGIVRGEGSRSRVGGWGTAIGGALRAPVFRTASGVSDARETGETMGKEKLVTRRSVVGGALAVGASALTLGCLDAPRAPAQAAEEPAEQPAADEAVKKAQFGFLLKVKNCVDCGECVKACRLWSRTPDGAEARRTVASYITPAGREVFVSTSCMHCAVPACVSVCPAGAIKKGDGGVVAVDKDRCIGCKYCFQACPYGVPHYTASGMDKCDCCVGNGVALGDEPHCVKACKVGALQYGTLEELMASTKGKARRINGTTGPSYLLV